MTSTRDPQAEIAADNPWYVEDQFAIQLGSPAFRAVVENRWHVFSAALDDWIRAAGGPPARLLDAGCGDGINLSYFARLGRERRWSTRVIGADYSPLRVDRAKAADAGLIRTSVTALGFADRTFDVVLCNQVLEHVPDDRLAFGELCRVLRPGGLLLVGVPNEGSPLGILRNHVLQRSILRTTDHVNMYNQRMLRDRLSGAGLQVTQIVADGFFVPHTRLHSWLYASALARRSLNAMTSKMPSCAAGLLAAAVRPV